MLQNKEVKNKKYLCCYRRGIRGIWTKIDDGKNNKTSFCLSGSQIQL